jgi:hypothetical protein
LTIEYRFADGHYDRLPALARHFGFVLRSPPHVWMAPAWQEIIWRAAFNLKFGAYWDLVGSFPAQRLQIKVLSHRRGPRL